MKSLFRCLAILCAGLATPALAQTLTPCAVTVIEPQVLPAAADEVQPRWRRVPPNPVGCTFGVPLIADPETTLWRCAIEYPDDHEYDEADWEYAILVDRGVQPMQAFRDEVMAGMLDEYLVLKVDLDADGSEERLVATWNAQGNGLGVNSWTIQVFTNDWRPIALYQEVLDWGRSSIVQAGGGRKGCDLALTTFEDFGPSAPGSMAFAAKFVRLESGAMVAATDWPPVRKRLLNSFMRMRDATLDENLDDYEGDVAKWLSP